MTLTLSRRHTNTLHSSFLWFNLWLLFHVHAKINSIHRKASRRLMTTGSPYPTRRVSSLNRNFERQMMWDVMHLRHCVSGLRGIPASIRSGSTLAFCWDFSEQGSSPCRWRGKISKDIWCCAGIFKRESKCFVTWMFVCRWCKSFLTWGKIIVLSSHNLTLLVTSATFSRCRNVTRWGEE